MSLYVFCSRGETRKKFEKIFKFFLSPQFPFLCQVGSVMNIRPSLERVDVLVEMRDQSTVIPRNSLIEANQSGLVSDAFGIRFFFIFFVCARTHALETDCE